MSVGPSAAELLLVAAAGFGAGAANAIAGGGTLLTFPALLATGVPPVLANTTSAVGLLTGYVGGSLGYRRELVGQGARMRALSVVSLAGGLVGAFLLLATPAAAFRAVVPYLVLTSCALLAAQPRLAAAVARRRGQDQDQDSAHRPDITAPVVAGVGLAAVYGSYFGAGLGVLLLAVLGVFVSDSLQRLNALKGLLSLVINVVGVAVFIASGHVVWSLAAVIAVTSLLGGLAGSSLARRIPAGALRISVIALGVVIGLALLR